MINDMKKDIQQMLIGINCATILMTASWQAQAEPQSNDACNEQLLQPAQIRCFLDAAEAANEPSICERAEDPVVRLHCLSLYAEHSLDTGPCQRIIAGNSETQLWQDSCVSGVAMARRDPALCDQVSISEIRDSCYMMLVVQFGSNSGICERIENPTLKNTCSE